MDYKSYTTKCREMPITSPVGRSDSVRNSSSVVDSQTRENLKVETNGLTSSAVIMVVSWIVPPSHALSVEETDEVLRQGDGPLCQC